MIENRGTLGLILIHTLGLTQGQALEALEYIEAYTKRANITIIVLQNKDETPTWKTKRQASLKP
jgi:hypothetical protein